MLDRCSVMNVFLKFAHKTDYNEVIVKIGNKIDLDLDCDTIVRRDNLRTTSALT